MIEDPERCYRAASSRDPRFDGWFIVAVTTTGIYCRPSCPARTPKRGNVRFFPTAAAAQTAGFRSCKRCRPDAAPGSPEWNTRSDTVARAMRLIADGVVDREGVTGLASRLGYSGRHLDRLLVAELGAGPLALARAQRAQTARVLIETTDLPFSEVAFGSGFGSLRQFNDTVRAVFVSTPTCSDGPGGTPRPSASPARSRSGWRGGSRSPAPTCSRSSPPGRSPASRRSREAPTGAPSTCPAGRARCTSPTSAPTSRPRSGSTTCAISSRRWPARGRLLDLDADPAAVDEHLEQDPDLGPLVRKTPGRRVPGAVAGHELAVKAVIGQQVSVAGARTVAGRLTRSLGRTLPQPVGSLTHLFPTVEALAEADPEGLPMPRSCGRALTGLAAAVAADEVDLDPGADRARSRAQLLARPGIGPWTADYLVMRALGDPDVFLSTDLGVRHALAAWPDGPGPPAVGPLALLCHAPPVVHVAVKDAPLRQAPVATPIGTLTLVASPAGLREVRWADAPEPSAAHDPAFPVLERAAAQLVAYFGGWLRHFVVPLDLVGTEFQRRGGHRLATIDVRHDDDLRRARRARRRPRPSVRRSARPTGPTRCRSCSRVTASSARTGRSPGSAGGWT